MGLTKIDLFLHFYSVFKEAVYQVYKGRVVLGCFSVFVFYWENPVSVGLIDQLFQPTSTRLKILMKKPWLCFFAGYSLE